MSAEAGQALGRGAQHFALLMSIQLAVLYTLVPILAAGAIAAEKQQDTLALLLVTTLTPWQIVLQKFAARTASILSFVCLSFPLVGNHLHVRRRDSRRTRVRDVRTDRFLPATGSSGHLVFRLLPDDGPSPRRHVCGFLDPAAFISSNAFLQPPGVAGIIFATFTALICLAAAAGVLVDRAFVQSRNYLLEFFRGLDRFFEQLNVLTGGVVLVHDRGFLPGRAPIQWRETRKKSLGTFRYLFRVLVVLEFPILFCIQLMRFSTNASNLDDGGLVALLDMLWIASAALVALHAASLISEERSHQTLSVLMSTPLPSKRILSEKLSGVRRLTAILMVPFATIFLFEKWWYSRSSWDYVVLSALTVVIYLTVIRWTALAIGLRLPNQLSAIIGAISVIGLWVGGLALAGPLMSYLNIDLPPLENTIRAMSPVDMILAVQHSATYAVTRNGALSPWETSPAATVLHFVFYATLGFGLQWWCRRSADRYLGRIPEPQAPERWEVEAAALETAPRLSVNVD